MKLKFISFFKTNYHRENRRIGSNTIKLKANVFSSSFNTSSLEGRSNTIKLKDTNTSFSITKNIKPSEAIL